MANAALNRVFTCFGMSRYQGKENFKLYLLHPFYFFLSVINPDPIRYNGQISVITDKSNFITDEKNFFFGLPYAELISLSL